jgi:hypothetical protein
MARTVYERFVEKTAKCDNGCIEWTGSISADGYGLIRLGPDEGSRLEYAHRWSYAHHIGPIADGLVIDHLCRNRACVHPMHLQLVTTRENLLRGESFSARNAAKTHCPAGHPYDAANTYIAPRKRGRGRECRQCRAERRRRHYEKDMEVMV